MDLAWRRLLMHTALLAVLSTVVLSIGGYLLKAQCIGHYDAYSNRYLCSNDLQYLYKYRGMQQHPFPYVHGTLVDGRLSGGAIEYPVLTGLFAWVPALFVHDDGSYLRLSAWLLAPFSLLSAYLLSRMVGVRALLYAASPALFWYSFHNWDLLVVCATVGAFYAWWRQRYLLSGVLLAVGASLKLWPLFFVLPLLLERWAARDRPGAVRALVGTVGALLVVNLPFFLASPSGWDIPFAFQTMRAADITSESIWFWGFPQLTTHQLNRLIPVLLLVGFASAVGYGWSRVRRGEAFPFVQVSGAVLCLFMVTAKADSPQYALWLLPFFCLLRLRWQWWAAYTVFDALTYVGVFRWYYAIGLGNDFGIAKQELVLGVWGRAVMLVLLYGVFLRSQGAWGVEAADPAPERELVAA